MELNTYSLEKAGVDFEHGFSRYAGSAYQYNNMLLRAADDSMFKRIAHANPFENIGDLYNCADGLKRVAYDLGMTQVYEAASVLTEVLHDGDYDISFIDTALTELKAVVESTLTGIRKVCVSG